MDLSTRVAGGLQHSDQHHCIIAMRMRTGVKYNRGMISSVKKRRQVHTNKLVKCVGGSENIKLVLR